MMDFRFNFKQIFMAFTIMQLQIFKTMAPERNTPWKRLKYIIYNLDFKV